MCIDSKLCGTNVFSSVMVAIYVLQISDFCSRDHTLKNLNKVEEKHKYI
jgi:hypothetical protein